MSCKVTALPFQAHANYGTWSIDLETNSTLLSISNIMVYLTVHLFSLISIIYNIYNDKALSANRRTNNDYTVGENDNGAP